MNSRALLSAAVANTIVSDERIGRNCLFVPVGKREISKRGFVPAIFRRKTTVILSRRRLASPTNPCILIRSAASTVGGLTTFCEGDLSVGIINVAKDINGADAGRVVSSILRRGCDIRGATNGFGGRVNLPLAVFKVERDRRVTILRVNVSSFNRVRELSAVSYPSIVIVAGVNCYRLRFLNSESNILGTGARYFRRVVPSTITILGTSSSGLTAIRAMGKGPTVCCNGRSTSKVRGSMCAAGVRGLNFSNVGTRFIAPRNRFSTRVRVPNRRGMCGTVTTTTIKLRLNLAVTRVGSKVRGTRAVTKHAGFVGARNVAIVSSYCGTGPMSVGSSVRILSRTGKEAVTILNSVNRLKDSRGGLRRRMNRTIKRGRVRALFTTKRLTGRCTTKTTRGSSSMSVRCFRSERAVARRLLSCIGRNSAVLIGTSRFVRFPGIMRTLDGWGRMGSVK